MSSDLLSEEVEETLPIFHAFNREVPEKLQTPTQTLNDWLAELDRHIREFEELAQKPGSEAAAKKAASYRKDFGELEKKALKEMSAKKKDDKKLEALTDEVRETYDMVDAELEMPAREARVTKALATMKGRAKPASKSKVADFEKQQQDIAKEKDPKKRTEKYAKLERDIIKADLLAREEDDPGSTWQDQVGFALQDARPPGRLAKAGKALSGLKNKIFRDPDAISDEEFLALKASFVNSYTKKIEDMAFGVPAASQKEFKGKAAGLVSAIAGQAFDLAHKPADRQPLGKLLMVSNTKALQQLMALKRDYPPNMTPQVMVEDGKIVIMKPAPKAQSLVLQGGGSKGAGYPPMLDEMKNAGMLDQVDLLVGTSIGALNASCLACGGLADERQILDMPIIKQVFDSKNFKKQYPDVTFGTGTIWPSCAGQMAKIDQMTAASIADNLKSKSEDAMGKELSAKLAKLDDDTLAKMGLAGASAEVIDQEIKKLAKKVKNQDFKGSDRMSQMITFKDLAMLHQLDPVNFKELTITGWEGTGEDGHVEYFNAKDYGDMPIALAARISMGLPIFAPVYWQGRGPFYDGGLGSNTPVEATPGLDTFYKENQDEPGNVEDALRADVPVEVQEAMAKTMLMTFDDKGKGERNLYGQGKTTAAPSGAEKKLVIKSGINADYGETLTGDAVKVYNTGVNTLQVYHGDMDTVTILPSAEDIEYAENMSRMKGLEQLDARQDQAAMVKCPDTDQALLGLSSADKRNLVKAGSPDGADPLVVELYNKCVAYIAVEDSFLAITDDAGSFLDALEKSPLVASFADKIKQLHAQYNVHVKGGSNAEALAAGIKAAADLIGACPAYVRAMLKQAILLPMQQRNRGLKKATGAAAPTFLWQQDFSARAFDNSMTTAKENHVVDYLKQASAVHDALKKFDERTQQLADKKKPKDACEAARKTLTAAEGVLGNLRMMARIPAYASIPTLQDYIRWLQEKAGAEVDRLTAIVKGTNAVYLAHTFTAWDKKDWERKKDEAIEAGALEDVGSTGFGAAMEKAVKTGKSWENADEEAKDKAGKAAWNVWDRLIRKAKEVQGMTGNTNFAAYLEGCVTQAAKERDRFPAP
jgi:hypothetical protein